MLHSKCDILKRVIISLFHFVNVISDACAIEDENNLIITGGYDSGQTNRVTKYDRTGASTDLPTLNNARRSHGCGIYRDTNGQKVLPLNIFKF